MGVGCIAASRSDGQGLESVWLGYISLVNTLLDLLCGLVVRVFGYRSGGTGSIPGTTRKKSNGSGTGSTQPREYN
jgi:hypothetical protein